MEPHVMTTYAGVVSRGMICSVLMIATLNYFEVKPADILSAHVGEF